MKTIKERKMMNFLDRFSDILEKSDKSGTKKETALLYLDKNDLNLNNMDDLFMAMENSLKESDRLLSIQQNLVKQGDSPVDLPWLNESQTELFMQQQGILELMLQHCKRNE